jgi:hypothetical protein
MFTEIQVEEFKKIFEEQFEKNISKADAITQGRKLINLITMIKNNEYERNN